MPRVSVIMPAYNAVGTIGKALESLQQQTFPDFEIVVVDDRSTDRTYEFVQEMARHDPRIKVLQMPQNSGSSLARRMALEHASGIWITLCDADDWFEPERIGQLLITANAQHADMVVDNLLVFDHSANKIVDRTNFGKLNKTINLTVDNFFDLDHPLRLDSIGYAQPLIRLSFLREHEINYWGKYRNNEDFIILAEIVILGAKAVIIPEAYYVYRHRISPTTKRVSPTSHSASNTSLYVAEACDDLLEKYRTSLSPKAKRYLQRRKDIFLTSHIAGQQKYLFLQGKFPQALSLFFKHPSLWSYRAIGFSNRIRRALRRSFASAYRLPVVQNACSTIRVSVLMPAYNVEQTIRKALISLQAQTFANIEIIVMDDQSTDGTYDLVKEFARQDPRIKLFQTTENLGHGGASKAAMEHATGAWVTLLDADDWCEPNRIEMLLKAATDLNADIILDNLKIFDHALNRIAKQTNYGSSRSALSLNAEDIFRLDNPLRLESIGYSKPMMRTSFLREHNITYWGKYRNNEDFILLSEIMLAGARAFILPEAYYVYVHRISPTTREISPHSRSECDTSLLVAQSCDEVMEKHPAAFSAKARQELFRRKQIFLTASVAEMQRRLLNQGQYAQALALFAKHPGLWGYRAAGVRNRLYRTLRLAA